MNATTRSFPTPPEFWVKVEEWAEDCHYACRESTGSSRTYQRGSGLTVATTVVRLSKESETVTLESWICPGWLVRMRQWFQLPPTLAIEPDGANLPEPRQEARQAVNRLLADWAQPPFVSGRERNGPSTPRPRRHGAAGTAAKIGG
jgi:hypothetical protein